MFPPCRSLEFWSWASVFGSCLIIRASSLFSVSVISLTRAPKHAHTHSLWGPFQQTFMAWFQHWGQWSGANDQDVCFPVLFFPPSLCMAFGNFIPSESFPGNCREDVCTKALMWFTVQLNCKVFLLLEKRLRCDTKTSKSTIGWKSVCRELLWF